MPKCLKVDAGQRSCPIYALKARFRNQSFAASSCGWLRRMTWLLVAFSKNQANISHCSVHLNASNIRLTFPFNLLLCNPSPDGPLFMILVSKFWLSRSISRTFSLENVKLDLVPFLKLMVRHFYLSVILCFSSIYRFCFEIETSSKASWNKRKS